MRRIFIYFIYIFASCIIFIIAIPIPWRHTLNFIVRWERKNKFMGFSGVFGKIDDGDVMIIKRHTGRRQRWKFCNITTGLRTWERKREREI